MFVSLRKCIDYTQVLAFNSGTCHLKVNSDGAGKVKGTVASKGEHWKELGFRASDPTVTFKSGGLLALWMMLAFYKHNKELALKTLRESKETEGGYPFPALCDRMTEFVVRALRKGKLNGFMEDVVPSGSNSKKGSHQFPLIQAVQKLFVGFVYKYKSMPLGTHSLVVFCRLDFISTCEKQTMSPKLRRRQKPTSNAI